MAQDALLIVKFVFSEIWRLFTSWTFPGTHATPASWALFCLSVVLAVRLIRIFISRSGGDDK